MGNSGHRGPTPDQRYAGVPWREGDFSIKNGQQSWTVPANGTYRITAAGAYGATPGRVVSGDVALNQGQTLRMLVGQEPTPLTTNVADNVTVGGGGGTFVTTGNTPLIVASGGDGGAYLYGGWSLPTPVAIGQVPQFLTSSGEFLVVLNFNFNNGQLIGSTIYNDTLYTLPSESILYTDGSIVDSYNIVNSTTIQVNTRAYGSQTIQTSVTIFLNSSIQYYFWNNVVVSQNGATLTINDGGTYKLYRRLNGQWTFITQFDDFDNMFNTLTPRLSSDGNRFVCRPEGSSGGPVYVYDYPWQTPTTTIPLGSFEYLTCYALSPDGTLLVGRQNLISISSGQVVSSIPGYSTSYVGEYVNISGDNKTILKGAYSHALQVIYNGVVTEFSPPSFFSFQTCPLINYDGTLICSSDYPATNKYYKLSQPQAGAFSPFGNGSGGSGAGFIGDGSVTNPYFGFLAPKAYVNGGYGNAYEYGTLPYQGGFGGGQSPINKQNSITSFAVTPAQQVSGGLVAAQTVISVNKDGTVLYCDGSRYVYSNGTWSLDYSGGGVSLGFGSTSDDGSVFVYSPRWQYTFETGTGQIVYGTTNISLPNINVARASKDGSTVVYADGSNNVFVRKSPFTQEQQVPVTVTGNVYSVDTSSDGSVIAIGADSSCIIIRNQTEVDTIHINGDIVALSANGQFLFSVGAFSTPLYVYEYVQKQWTYVTQSALPLNSTMYLTCTYDNTILVNPIAAPGFVSCIKKYQNGSVSDMYNNINATFPTAISSDGTLFLESHPPQFVNFYNRQNILVTTSKDHGFPYNYQVQFEYTSNYNGTHDITVATSNTFTFQGFGSVSETGSVGIVNGTVTGVSGGGGYTGSPGTGVAGATCYADASVQNFTDLGATSNTNGYVTVELIDPPPIQQVSTWSNRTSWLLEGVQMKNCTKMAWSKQASEFIGINEVAFPVVEVSPDGKSWTTIETNLPFINVAHALIGADQCTVLSSESGLWSTVDTVTWTNTLNVKNPGVFTSGLSNIYFYSLSNVYVSGDGYTWSQTSTPQLDYVSYGNQKFVGLTSNALLYTSSDGVTWSESSNQSGLSSVSALTFTRDNTFLASGAGNRRLYQESCIFMIDSTLYTSGDGITWNSQYIAAASNGQPVYGNGVFIMSGFLRSEDTITWTPIDSPESIGTVAYGSNTFVGLGSSQQTVLTSPDGITWTVTSLDPSFYFSAIIYGNGSFYIYDSSRGEVGISSDGTSWTYQSATDIPSSSQHIVYGNGTFVWVDSSYGRVLSSSDGINWTQRGSMSSPLNVIFGNGIFVLNTPSEIYTSATGLSWTLRTIPSISYNLTPVSAYGINKFIVFLSNGSELVSSNGINWSLYPNVSGFYYIPSWPTIAVGLAVATSRAPSISYSSSGNTWSAVEVGDTLTQLSSTEFFGISASNVWYSPDLQNWYKSPVSFSFQNTIVTAPQIEYSVLTDSKYSYLTIDGQYVVRAVDNSSGFYQTTWSPQLGLFVGTGEGVVTVSPDGKAWTSVRVPLLTGVSAIEWAPKLGEFVAYCYANSFVSNDGYTWSSYTAPAVTIQSGYKALVWSESLSLFTLGGVTTTKDGVNWTTPTGNVISPIAWSPTLCVFSSGEYYSRDGASWTPSNGTFVTQTISWASALGTFLCIDIDGLYYTSKNGIQWSRSNLNIVGKSISNNFVVTNYYGYDPTVPTATGIYTTTDGVQYSQQAIPHLDGYFIWNVANYFNDKYIIYARDAFGGQNTYNLESPDGVTWSTIPVETYYGFFQIAYGNGTYIGARSGLFISYDNVNFTQVDTGVDGSWQNVAYGKGVFVAGNYYGGGLFPNYIITSYDGLTWTPRVVPDGAYRLVKFVNNTFLAISLSRIVLLSVDGIHWSEYSYGWFQYQWTDVAYGNGTYVVSGYDWSQYGGYPFMVSLDGKTWTAVSASNVPVIDSWYAVDFGNGIFIAVGKQGNIVTSSDGVHWTQQNAPDPGFGGWQNVVHPPPYFSSIVSTWSDELQIFLVAAVQDTKTYVFTSQDGISFKNEGYFYTSVYPLTSLTWSATRGFLLSDNNSFYLSQTPTISY
jgi:hypothetical protein